MTDVSLLVMTLRRQLSHHVKRATVLLQMKSMQNPAVGTDLRYIYKVTVLKFCFFAAKKL